MSGTNTNNNKDGSGRILRNDKSKNVLKPRPAPTTPLTALIPNRNEMNTPPINNLDQNTPQPHDKNNTATLTSLSAILGTLSDKIESFERRLAKIEGNLENQMQSVENRLTSKIESIAAVLDTRLMAIDSRISQIEKEFNHKLANVKVECDELLKSRASAETTQINQIPKRLIDLERVVHLNDVVIVGIPAVPGEDLKKTFISICKAVSFNNINSFVTAFRLKSGNNVNGGTIILKMTDCVNRNEFLHKCRSFKYLKTNHIGFESSADVFINESLGYHASGILREAIRLRKRGLISKAFSRNGSILVCKSDTSPLIKINNLEHLYNLNNTSDGRCTNN